jgi:GNAT superfamily N-acetyltransferase
VVGFVWVVFREVEGYDVTIAEINDIAVSVSHRRRRIGTEILEHVEALARKRGADLLRSDTGLENLTSDRLHTKAGFKPIRTEYEKVLNSPPLRKTPPCPSTPTTS